MDISKIIGKELLFLDGGMGSMLTAKGLLENYPTELVNIASPHSVVDIHRQYIQAGSRIISANTFGAYSHHYDNTEEIIAQALLNAKKAIALENRTDVFVALDMGPTGGLIQPLGNLTFEECYAIFKTSAMLGEKYGADLIILETIADTYEAKAALLAIKENTALPVIATMTFDDSGKNLTGGNILTMIALYESLGVSALGMNCGLGPQQFEKLLPEILKYASLPVIVQPNAGLPSVDALGNTVYDLTPAQFAVSMKKMCAMGASILGGCCGTTPEHIEKMVEACKCMAPAEVTDKGYTMISSYGRCLIIDQTPVIVGERINPTGKPDYKKALLTRDMDYVRNESLSQKEGGAHMLNVNVGLPEIDEQMSMAEVIPTIQAVCDLPLQIDAGKPEVIETALRLYNGKSSVNSVTGKQASMETLFPIIKKYGCLVVGLTLDENGIPGSAEERLAIAEKIVYTAEKYGIPRKSIIIDPLTLTVSAQQKEASETLRALTLIKEKLGVKTILGVSNISFGLPEREILNASFFAFALNAGLDMCIINPNAKSMMDIYNAYNVISGADENCQNYIETYSKDRAAAPPAKTDKTDVPLDQLVIKGLKDQAYAQAKEYLKTMEPIDIINRYLVKGLDYVGKKFETGKMFLPQLMMSAESAKSAFNAITEYMDSQGRKRESKGRIIVATVEGDSHDIGKNIVKALLENYGYDIIDLGKDVPVSLVVQTAVENDIRLVGLSALMTTTVVNMEKTIALLREKHPHCKVMVGGAVLNDDYAKMIHADYYAKDALAAVAIAKDIFDANSTRI